MTEVIAIPPEKRWVYRELLLLADPEEQAIRRYLDESDMYVLRVNGCDAAEAVVREKDGECELMNLAVREDMQGRGYGSKLVKWLKKKYSERFESMLVGTSEDGRPFYRRLGFEDAFVRKHFFIDHYQEKIIDNGKQCVDMYCLRVRLRRESV